MSAEVSYFMEDVPFTSKEGVQGSITVTQPAAVSLTPLWVQSKVNLLPSGGSRPGVAHVSVREVIHHHLGIKPDGIIERTVAERKEKEATVGAPIPEKLHALILERVREEFNRILRAQAVVSATPSKATVEIVEAIEGEILDDKWIQPLCEEEDQQQSA